jgi:hypothetical protein
MRPTNIFYSLLLLLTSIWTVAGDQDTRLTKNVSKSYKVPYDVQLEVRNKYGSITINSWEKDSVKALIEIKAYGKNQSAVTKELDRVEIEFVNNRDYVLIETILDRKSGFFAELWNNIGDYSKTLLSKNQLEINYTVFVPETADVSIMNRYGDVFTNTLQGEFKCNLAHGNLRADVIENGRVELNFGSLRLKEMKKGSLILKGVDAEITYAGKVDLISSSSEVLIEEAELLKLDSQSDKKITIKSAEIVTGVTRFSNISMRSISNALDLDMNFGELKMAPVKPGFRSITVKSKSTDIRIAFDPATYMYADIEAKEEMLTIPDITSVKKRYLDDKERYLSVTGNMGDKSDSKSTLSIRSENGEVWIKYIDPSKI